MKKSIKSLLLLMTVVVLCFAVNLSAFASNETNDGNIKIEVATDKGSYSATGVAEITATISNVSGEDIKKVTAQAVFDDLAPAGKRKSETSKSVDVLKSGESFSFTYKATLNKDEHKLNIFQKIILWFVRLFNGGYNAKNNNIDVVAECVTEIEFGKFIAENVVQVGYEEIEAESNDYTYEELIENVDIDKLYEYDDNDITVKDGVEFINNIIVITFEDYCKDERKAEIINSVNGKVVGGDTFYNDLYIEVEKSSFEELENICYKISNKDGVYSADFVIFNTIIDYLPNDPYSEDKGVQLDWNIAYENINTTYNHWWILLSEIHRAWDYDSYFENINIGVVDEGFLTSHKDLDISVVSEENVPNNHGTHVAGIIGAKHNNGEGLAGVVNNCSLYGYSLSHITDEEVYKALRILVAEHNCKVINLSIGKKVYEKDNKVYLDKAFKTGLSDYRVNDWGKKASKKMADLLEKGYDFVVVQSAGNGAYNTNRGIDADNNGYFCSIKKENCYSNKTVSVDDIMNRILVVANADKDSTGCSLDRASNGNISYVDIAAPGIWNFSTVAGIEQNDGDFKITAGQEYAKIGGTSMAAPVVAGVTGLVWSVNENFTGAEVREIVIETAKKGGMWVEDNPYSLTTGDFPLVNAKLAVEEAISRTYGEMATITGTVYNETMTEVIPDVKIEVKDNSSDSFDPIATATTDLNGKYTLKLPYGDYSISFTHSDYEYYGMSLTVNNESYTKDITLSPKGNNSGGNNESGENGDAGDTEDRLVTASGECGAEGDNVTWTLYEDGELVISGSGEMEDYGQLTFWNNNSPWYNKKNQLKVINIDNGITRIGNYSFRDCDNLEIVNIPNSITSIGNGAFSNCNSITNIVIPDSVNSIGYEAFTWCKKLKTINIPNGVTIIEGNTFSCCESLETVTLPEELIEIGYSAFSSCSNLKNIEIPNRVTKIGNSAFRACESLEKITIPSGINTIKWSTFQYCRGLKTVIIPNSVNIIEDSAFGDCSRLTNVTIPQNVTYIGNAAFADCKNIINISLPEGIEYIGNGAFAHCENLLSIVIPNSVLEIGTGLFESCIMLKSVSIGNGLTKISDSTFANCNNLTNISIPQNIVDLGNSAFARCNNLASITIPNGITNIGDSAFLGCYSLIEIHIPSSTVYIGEYAFNECYSLKYIYINKNNPKYCNDEYGVLFNKEKTQLIKYPNGNELTSYVMPNDVAIISSYAFYNCDNLENVIISSNVKTIGENAYTHCDKLENINIPTGIKSIGNYAFMDCVLLESIIIPQSVTTIGKWAFYGCYILRDIYYTGSEEKWNEISVGEEAFFIDSYDNEYATIHYNS